MTKRAPRHSASGPDKSIRITTYDKLQEVAQHFAEGKLGNVLIVGPPGVGKTATLRMAVHVATDGMYAYMNNHAAPFGFYALLWQYQNIPLIIDDIRAINSNPTSVGLLMAVCDSVKPKLVTWTAKNITRDTEPPNAFETNSDVAMITNQWDTLDERVKALEDRCMCYHFAPSAQALHEYVGTWFGDQEVYDWMSTRIYQVRQPSIRAYLQVKQLRDAGAADWQDDAAVLVGVDPVLATAINLALDVTLKPAERVKEFKRLTGQSKANYYRMVNLAKELTPGGANKLMPPRHKLSPPQAQAEFKNAEPTNTAEVEEFGEGEGERAILKQLIAGLTEEAKPRKMKKTTKSKKGKGKKKGKK
jgi:DNA polymerase III delta prime subunit